MTITSQDCKDYIVEQLNNEGVSTNASEWKRVKKFKSNNDWVRIFSYPGRSEIVVLEHRGVLSIVSDTNEEKFNPSQVAEIISKNNPEYLKNLINGGLNLDLEVEGMPLLSYCIKHKLDKCFDLLLDAGADFFAHDYMAAVHPVAVAAKSPYIHFIRRIVSHAQFNLQSAQSGEPLGILIFDNLSKRQSDEEFLEIFNLFDKATQRDVLVPLFESMTNARTVQKVIESYQAHPEDISPEHPLFVLLVKNEKFDLATQYYQTLKINPHTIKINHQPIKNFFNFLNNSYANQGEYASEGLRSRFYAIQAFFTSIAPMEVKKSSNSPLLVKKKKF